MASTTSATLDSSADAHRMVGRSVLRKEDRPLLTGAARFVDDVHRPGMVHATILRSPHAHARIESIDAGAARAAPGVLAV
ncbi:MAG: aerobic carbon-monoxide dehydrogenase large subunit, partial [Thermoleophilaceae bacterium]|nr:aerobic carbon-monoxide dehydrogenase large subunit [Thermoleophilaceae bacterium]